MSSLVGRARFASLLAVACALLLTGVAAGAAGDALILGANNDSGSSQTVLANAGLGSAFTLRTTNASTNATGIFGWSSSTADNATRGVYGRADGPNSYGVFARQNSGTEGSGAAVFAEGNQNEGVIATSADATAVRGTVTGCDGLLCGGHGLSGDGYGFAAGVFGDGVDTLAGLWGQEGLIAAVYATQTGEDLPAVFADSATGTGIQAYGENGASPSVTTAAGGSFSGSNGVYGQTDVGFGAGVYGRSNGGFNFALYGQGNAYVTGNFTVDGTCTGCTAAALAVNGSGSTLKQGDAVALDGVTTAPDGSILLVVRAAKKSDAVVGVVDREMKAAPESMKVGGTKRTIKVDGEGDKTVTSPERSVKAVKGAWEDGGVSVAADKYLRIITGGVFAFEGAAPTDASAGDALAVAGSTGKLGKVAADSGAKAGRYLGKLKDGRVVLMVDPS
jgi:hypothetical protein